MYSYWSAILETLWEPCDVTVKGMTTLESTSWVAMTWNSSHLSAQHGTYVARYVPCSYIRWPQLLQRVCVEVYPPPSLPTLYFPSPIPIALLLYWPDFNVHLTPQKP